MRLLVASCAIGGLALAAGPAHGQWTAAGQPAAADLPRVRIPSARMLAERSFLLPYEHAGPPPALASAGPGPAVPPLELVTAGRVGPVEPRIMGVDGVAMVVPADPAQRGADNPWWAPLASAAVPGAGQARLGQDRFIAYLALEGFLWARYAADRREAVRERAAYRRMADRVSRAAYPGDKPVGDFEYYERMEDWVASGLFDRDPGTPALEPETDTTTYNGAMWLLARKTYWPTPDTPPPPGSPAAIAAMRFYQESAYRPEFQWSWRGARYEQDIFRRHIRASNEAFRNSIEDIGVVIANHVLSTVDAYISLRLRLRATQLPGVGSDYAVTATIPWEPRRARSRPGARGAGP